MGRATALLLAESGCSLILADLNEVALKETASLTKLSEQQVMIRKIDICDEAQVETLYKDIEERFGRLDYAVCVTHSSMTRGLCVLNVASPFALCWQ